MSEQETRRAARIRRHRRIRKRVRGTAERPRLAVFRSVRHIYAQLIDDEAGRTLVAASDTEPAAADARAGDTKMARAQQTGALLGQRAKAVGVGLVVFDRGGFAYRGRVRALAEAARTEGLEF